MTQRDWQKDMEMCKGFLTDSGWSRRDLIAEQPQMSMYWLQEAKELQEIVSGRGRELLRHRDLLKGLNDELTATEARADAAEEREQRLKELLSDTMGCLVMSTSKDNEDVARIAADYRTLYPDTPAPTPEITARPIEEWHEEIGDVLWWMFPIQEPPYCGNPLDSDWSDCYTHWTPIVIPAAPAPKEVELWDTVNHLEYGKGGVLEIIGTKARVSFDELDYHITLETSELNKVKEEDNQ